MSVVVLGLCACAGVLERQDEAPLFRLQLCATLEHERGGYEADIVAGSVIVNAFFETSGFESVALDLIHEVVVYASTEQARRDLAARFDAPIDAIPDTFAGTVVDGALYLVSRDAYKETFLSLYPDWPFSEGAYRRLIAHELAHAVHERLVIDRYGTADAMGPVWFFEGLAVMAAGQFDSQRTLLSREQLWALVGEGRIPETFYPHYGLIVRSLARRYGVKQMIYAAAASGFPDGLLASDMPGDTRMENSGSGP